MGGSKPHRSLVVKGKKRIPSRGVPAAMRSDSTCQRNVVLPEQHLPNTAGAFPKTCGKWASPRVKASAAVPSKSISF